MGPASCWRLVRASAQWTTPTGAATPSTKRRSDTAPASSRRQPSPRRRTPTSSLVGSQPATSRTGSANAGELVRGYVFVVAAPPDPPLVSPSRLPVEPLV